MKTGVLAILFMISAIFACDCEAQSTKRRNVRPATMPATVHKVHYVTDTITDAKKIDQIIRITSFKKTVASRVETVMLTNLTTSDTIRSVSVDIDYRTCEGEQLNRRTVVFEADVPPGETRHASVTSWDRQQLFYHTDTPPNRPSQRTTPFTVTLTPLSLILTPSTP